MTQVVYSYGSNKYTIQCNQGEKLKDINERLKTKIGKVKDNIYYLFDGKKLNEEQTIDEISGGKQTIQIIITDKEEEKKVQNNENKDIICPQCKDIASLYFKNFKFDIQCKNGHNFHDILIKEFKNDIICVCGKNRADTYNNQFFHGNLQY